MTSRGLEKSSKTHLCIPNCLIGICENPYPGLCDCLKITQNITRLSESYTKGFGEENHLRNLINGIKL